MWHFLSDLFTIFFFIKINISTRETHDSSIKPPATNYCKTLTENRTSAELVTRQWYIESTYARGCS